MRRDRWKPISASLLSACLVATASTTAWAQSERRDESRRVDLSTLGPQVGEVVPDFSLPDQTGQIRNLRSILGPNGTMLVFYRSADW